jgi:hypothetical protein
VLFLAEEIEERLADLGGGHGWMEMLADNALSSARLRRGREIGGIPAGSKARATPVRIPMAGG